MVTLQDVYDAFLSRVEEDEWDENSEEAISYYLKDWRSLLNAAITQFKFPRCSLDINEQLQCFTDPNMTLDEVNILAIFMKQQWVHRTIDSWKNIKTQYDEKDFSQANLLSQFIKLKDQIDERARLDEAKYYRSIRRKPFHFDRLAGK